jgi:hypothetical protein
MLYLVAGSEVILILLSLVVTIDFGGILFMIG